MESKLQKWESIKDFFDFMPENAELELRGIKDDSKYFHPKFKITEELFITCQADTYNEDAYGFCFEFKEIPINHYLFKPSISIDSKKLKYVVENLNLIEPIIKDSLKRQTELFELEQKIISFRKYLFHNDLFEKLENIEQKKSKAELSNMVDEIKVSLFENRII